MQQGSQAEREKGSQWVNELIINCGIIPVTHASSSVLFSSINVMASDSAYPPAPAPVVTEICRIIGSPTWKSMTLGRLLVDDVLLLEDIFEGKSTQLSLVNILFWCRSLMSYTNALYLSTWYTAFSIALKISKDSFFRSKSNLKETR